LARNGRDWHTLIEFCGLVGTVIVDEDGVYDPRHPNDRLLLGMHAYIYLGYGTSYMLNVSSKMPGIGARVLIRALEPLEGVRIMQLNRGIDRLRDLARGPGRLAVALRVDRRLDGLDLCREGPLWLRGDDNEPGEIGQSMRIGIARDADRLLRFYLSDSPFVSGPRSLNIR